MDWRSVNFDWNRARAFLVTAEEGSLSAAARALEITQPTLSRQVTALEKELGVALFERIGRGLELTPNGLDLLQHVRAMGEAANQLALTASGRSESVEGHICLSATEVTAAYTLPPLIQKLRQQQPGISVEIVASNHASDLQRREADIALRAFQPTQPELIARRVGDIEVGLYASTDYLSAIGHPTTLAAFNRADYICFGENERLIEAMRHFGLELSRQNFPLITESHLVHWELVKQGLAIGIMPADIGDREPGVVRVMPERSLLTTPLWLVAHRELKTNRRVRVVFDFLAQELSGAG
ncbi:LysR family transcriptional regulator [Marinobacterium jannaschii]|uniref:LysR family transcriptional regulator n=1 Tax=Marinobacterium jannaschii TaxID=64970 RepID=UPI000481B7A0|nr:LysR family transcriptional regulator [Marinobacterium jannaschii]